MSDLETFGRFELLAMIRHIKQWFAIRSYVMRLSGEVAHRFGLHRYYTIEQVTQAVERGGFATAFIAFAHGIYCSRHDFDAHYQGLGVCCTYDGVRSVVARRYFHGSIEFDAKDIVRAFRQPRHPQETHFHESGEGMD